MQLVTALCGGIRIGERESMYGFDDLCESLVTVFEWCGQSRQLLKWAIETETKASGTSVTGA